jgi:TolB-like protein/Flp pilus assembly protein TadD
LLLRRASFFARLECATLSLASPSGLGGSKLLFSFENFVLDTDRRELRGGAGLIAVEPQVFDLLAYLIQNRGRVVSRDDIFAAVWNGRIVSESTLTTRLNAARTAIGDSGEDQRLIKTLPRKGMRFVGTVREEHAPTIVTLPHPSEQASPLTLPDGPSIAVLPFTNLSGDPEQEYFADGMAEEIITALSRCHWLFIIARNSSFTYKGKTVDVRQVGRELGVRYVLEGSVRRGGNRLRFLGQLVDATSGAQIWADRFDGEMTDVFDLQDRFTESVVAAIEPMLQLAEIDRLKHKPAANLHAYDLLLRAQQLEHEFTAESLATAIRCTEQALAIDRHYAHAMALAAHCYGMRFIQGWANDAAAEAAEGVRLATHAVEHRQDDGNVLWLAAQATLYLAKDRERARDLVYKSLELNPNSAAAVTVGGVVETMSGNSGKALELLQRAHRLSPRDPRGWLTAGAMALAHLTDGRFEEAVTFCNRALLHNPRFGGSLRVLAASFALLDQRQKAAEALQRVRKVDPELSLARLRVRLAFMHDRVWNPLAEGLKLAGFRE